MPHCVRKICLAPLRGLRLLAPPWAILFVPGSTPHHLDILAPHHLVGEATLPTLLQCTQAQDLREIEAAVALTAPLIACNRIHTSMSEVITAD